MSTFQIRQSGSALVGNIKLCCVSGIGICTDITISKGDHHKRQGTDFFIIANHYSYSRYIAYDEGPHPLVR